MTVDGSQVAEPEFLEDHTADQTRLHPFLDLRQKSFGRIAEDWDFGENFRHLAFEPGVVGVGAKSIEVTGDRSDAGADRHLVVIENDQQILVQFTGVIHRLKDNPAGKSSIADHRDASAMRFPHQDIARFEP